MDDLAEPNHFRNLQRNAMELGRAAFCTCGSPFRLDHEVPAPDGRSKVDDYWDPAKKARPSRVLRDHSGACTGCPTHTISAWGLENPWPGTPSSQRNGWAASKWPGVVGWFKAVGSAAELWQGQHPGGCRALGGSWKAGVVGSIRIEVSQDRGTPKIIQNHPRPLISSSDVWALSQNLELQNSLNSFEPCQGHDKALAAGNRSDTCPQNFAVIPPFFFLPKGPAPSHDNIVRLLLRSYSFDQFWPSMMAIMLCIQSAPKGFRAWCHQKGRDFPQSTAFEDTSRLVHWAPLEASVAACGICKWVPWKIIFALAWVKKTHPSPCWCFPLVSFSPQKV